MKSSNFRKAFSNLKGGSKKYLLWMTSFNCQSIRARFTSLTENSSLKVIFFSPVFVFTDICASFMNIGRKIFWPERDR